MPGGRHLSQIADVLCTKGSALQIAASVFYISHILFVAMHKQGSPLSTQMSLLVLDFIALLVYLLIRKERDIHDAFHIFKDKFKEILHCLPALQYVLSCDT